MNTYNYSEIDRGSAWQQFSECRDKGRRDRLTEAYLPLVRGVAAKMCLHLFGHLDVDDLASAGALGLMRAIESYDLGRGTTFEAYAYPRIRGAMLDHVRSCDWVPRLARGCSRRRAKAEETFQAVQGRKPSEHELAEELGTSDCQARKVMSQRIPTMMSLDRSEKTSGKGQELRTFALLPNKQAPDPAAGAIRKDLKEFLLRHLNRKERQLVLLYYYRNLTMKEVGAVMGLSESRVSQMHHDICANLHQQLAGQASELQD